MPSTVLYRKWRPQTLSEVVGQEHVTRTLLNALTTGKLAHAYLFTGPRGTGKTSTARILAKAINCQTNGKGEPCGECGMCQAIAEGRAMDVIEIDAASNNSVDDVRDLRDRIAFTPSEARYRIYIIDEVHMLSAAAFNALLKTLEEPPPHAVFVLATTEVHRVPPTILSRCQRFDFRRIPQQALAGHLAHICDAEALEYEPAALDLIARAAAGGARDAVSLLEQVEVAYGGRVTLADARQQLGISGDPRAVELIRCVGSGDLTTGMQLIQAVREDGVQLPQFGKEVALHLRNLMLIKADAQDSLDLPSELASELRSLAGTTPLDTITRALRIFGQLDFRNDTASSLPLELALVDSVLAPTPQVVAGPSAGPSANDPGAAPPQTTRAPASSSPRPTAPAQAPSPMPAPRPQPPAVADEPVPAPPARTIEPPASRPARPQPSQRAVGEPPAPAFEPTPAAKPPAGNGSTGHSVEEMQELVKKVSLPRIRFIEQLLKSNFCAVTQVQDRTVTFAFGSNFKAHKERLEQDANLRQVEQALKELTGIDYRVRVVLVDGNGGNGGPGNGAGPSGGGPRPNGDGPKTGHLVRAALNAGARPIQPDD